MKLGEIPKLDARLTLLCHQGSVVFENNLPHVQEINPELTMECAAKIDANAWAWLKVQPDFLKLLRCVFPEKQFDLPDHPLHMHGTGFRHTVGLILLTLAAIKEGKTPFIRYPESYLHPAQQVGLTDLFLAMGVNDKKPTESKQ